jgi:outer membrane protein assembly factor BamB
MVRSLAAAATCIASTALAAPAAARDSWQANGGEKLFDSAPPPRALNKLFTVEWRRELADVSDIFLFKPQETGQPAYDRNTGNVYVATREGRIVCLDSDGHDVWEFQGVGSFNGGPTLYKERLYAAGAGGFLYALDSVDGKLLWKYDAKEELLTAPVVTDDLVYVMSTADALFAIGTTDGKWRWQHRRDSASTLTVRGAARPGLRDGVLYAGFADGYGVAFDAKEGTVKWATRLSLATRTQLYDVDADVVFSPDGAVYMASYSDGIYRMRADNGQVEWHTHFSGIASMSIRDWTLYAGGAGHLYAVNAVNGKITWDVPMTDLAARAPVAFDHLVVSATSGPLLFVDATSGRPLRAFDPGRGVCATPVFAEGRLYVFSNRGELYALRMEAPGAP